MDVTARDMARDMGLEERHRGRPRVARHEPMQAEGASAVALHARGGDQPDIQQPLVGDDLGVDGDRQRCIGRPDVDVPRLLQRRWGRRLAEGHEAVIEGARANRVFDVGPGVAQDAVRREGEVEPAGTDRERDRAAAFVGQPSQDEHISRLGHEGPLDDTVQQQERRARSRRIARDRCEWRGRLRRCERAENSVQRRRSKPATFLSSRAVANIIPELRHPHQ